MIGIKKKVQFFLKLIIKGTLAYTTKLKDSIKILIKKNINTGGKTTTLNLLPCYI